MNDKIDETTTQVALEKKGRDGEEKPFTPLSGNSTKNDMIDNRRDNIFDQHANNSYFCVHFNKLT